MYIGTLLGISLQVIKLGLELCQPSFEGVAQAQVPTTVLLNKVMLPLHRLRRIPDCENEISRRTWDDIRQRRPSLNINQKAPFAMEGTKEKHSYRDP